MTKYCEVHGAVEVPQGPPNQVFKCEHPRGSGICGMRLVDQPTLRALPLTAADPRPETTQNSAPDTRERAERSDKLLHQGAFLAAYRRLGVIGKAATEAGVDRRRHYEWLDDPEYEAAFKDAQRDCIDDLVDHVMTRARGLDGSPASDRLAIKLLESIPADRMPAGWKFNNPTRHEHTGAGGKPIDVNVSPTEQLLSRIASLAPGTPEAPAS